jgi:hypothetical protein
MITNYIELLDAVSRFWNKPNLASFIPDFVSLAQIKMNRLVRVDWLSKRTDWDATVDSINNLGQEFILPADFNGVRYIKVIGSPIKSLRYITPEAADSMNLANQTGYSRYYTIDSKILTIYPYPSLTDQIRFCQYYRPVQLSQSQQTNEYTDNAMDLLMFGSLIEATMYTKDAEMIPMWNDRFNAGLESVIEDDKQRRWGETAMEMSSPYSDSLDGDVSTG